MSRRLVNITLDNLDDLPHRCRGCVFWELDPVSRDRAHASGGAALETLLKDAVQRTRPEYATHYLAIGSYSFPSGHATLSSIAMAMVVYSLSVTTYLRGVARTIAAIIAALWVLLVGTSRLYLGLHYPSDVLGGLVIGGAWFLVCVLVVNVAVRRRSPAPSNG